MAGAEPAHPDILAMSRPTFLDALIGSGSGPCALIDVACERVLVSRVEPALDSKTRRKGLLGRESIPDDYALVIAPSNAVHTWFMRIPIDLVFVSRSGTVTKTCRAVKPWRMAGSLKAFAVIEATEGFIERHGIKAGDVVALRAAPAGGSKPGP